MDKSDKWIKAAHPPGDSSGEVLVFKIDPLSKTGEIAIAFYSSGSWWFNFEGNSNVIEITVTHWQPLPPPPQD